MNMRKKKNKNVFNYNGYLLNHQDNNYSKVNRTTNSKVITIVITILFIAIIFLIIGIIWNLK